MRRLQAAQLHHQQEQEAPDREVCDQEVLSELPESYGSQGNQGLTRGRKSGALAGFDFIAGLGA
jgi:hypothetical protein